VHRFDFDSVTVDPGHFDVNIIADYDSLVHFSVIELTSFSLLFAFYFVFISPQFVRPIGRRRCSDSLSHLVGIFREAG